jgi:hypothetical protein
VKEGRVTYTFNSSDKRSSVAGDRPSERGMCCSSSEQRSVARRDAKHASGRWKAIRGARRGEDSRVNWSEGKEDVVASASRKINVTNSLYLDVYRPSVRDKEPHAQLRLSARWAEATHHSSRRHFMLGTKPRPSLDQLNSGFRPFVFSGAPTVEIAKNTVWKPCSRLVEGSNKYSGIHQSRDTTREADCRLKTIIDCNRFRMDT